MRSVNEQSHQHSTEGTSNRNRQNPCSKQEADSLPVDSLDGTVAQTNTDGGTGDAHRSRNGEGILGEDEDGEGGAHFHGGSSAWGVVGDFVTHD